MRVKGKVGTVEFEGSITNYVRDGDDRQYYYSIIEFSGPGLDEGQCTLCTVDQSSVAQAESDIKAFLSALGATEVEEDAEVEARGWAKADGLEYREPSNPVKGDSQDGEAK